MRIVYISRIPNLTGVYSYTRRVSCRCSLYNTNLVPIPPAVPTDGAAAVPVSKDKAPDKVSPTDVKN